MNGDNLHPWIDPELEARIVALVLGEASDFEREELERQKRHLDELNHRKEEFVAGQIEISERLTTSITSIDRELFELRQELDDLEQTRQSFAAHLTRIEKSELARVADGP